MKRFTKVCLVLGILLLVSGAALGGVSYGLGVEKDIRSAMNPTAPEMEEITIPGAELEILRGEGHGSYIVHSEKIARLILDYCRM